MKIKNCLYYLGLSCFPISILSLANIFYSYYFDHLLNVNTYLIVLVSSLFFGLFLFIYGKKFKGDINIYEQIFLVFLVYFFISFFILIPFYLSIYEISFIDSFFSPVRKVSFKVENSRVGQVTDYDKLIMQIETESNKPGRKEEETFVE